MLIVLVYVVHSSHFSADRCKGLDCMSNEKMKDCLDFCVGGCYDLPNGKTATGRRLAKRVENGTISATVYIVVEINSVFGPILE